jgi:isopentenyl-diphosphate delta-isomerase
VKNEPSESLGQFEIRKQDHIQLSLDDRNEAIGGSDFERLKLNHCALPEMNFSEVSLVTQTLGVSQSTPFLVSSMTAGHAASPQLNELLARACAARGWLMGVGSQRRELSDVSARQEWKAVRKAAPGVRLLANIGLAQLVETSPEKILDLVEALEGLGVIIHLNSLQEVVQPEGTPYFKNGLASIRALSKKVKVPVIVKETGCGFSKSTLIELQDAGVAAVDVSGFGGTHWGRIEGDRNREGSQYQKLAQTFSNWGISTVQSLLNARVVSLTYEVWASGGVRTGLDAAKSIALGANVVGFAKPILKAALDGEEALLAVMSQMELELRVALFCTGSRTPDELRAQQEVVTWQNL